MKLADITNNTYGDLTVLCRHGATNDGKATWQCICSCGNIVIRRGKQLRKSKDNYLNCGLTHPSKICPECKIDKHKSDYHKCKYNANNLQAKCKACTAKRYVSQKDELQLKYRENSKNPEFKKRLSANSKKSRIKNRESEAQYKYEYTRREEVKVRRRLIHANRKQIDINYNIKRRLRWRLRDILKSFGKKHKYKSSLVLLGCDLNYFRKYIEDKFTDGMSWDNIAEWHLDHIKPCSSFDLTDLSQQKECFFYKNLQPLWGVDNLKKGSQYPYLVQ